MTGGYRVSYTMTVKGELFIPFDRADCEEYAVEYVTHVAESGELLDNETSVDVVVDYTEEIVEH